MKDYLSKIITNGKAMYLAYDHGFEHGPEDLIGESINPEHILDIAIKGKYNAVILQKGLAEKYYTDTEYQKQIPLIIKINGKADIWKGGDLYSRQNCSVKYAKELGASAVGYTIFLGSIKRAIIVKIEVIIITQMTKYQLFLNEFSVASKASR